MENMPLDDKKDGTSLETGQAVQKNRKGMLSMKRRRQIISMINQITDNRYLEYLYTLIKELMQSGQNRE